MTNQLFATRLSNHNRILENEIEPLIRKYSDRKHLPDSRTSFNGIPCSYDLKKSVFIEDSSHDEYWRCWNEGEPIFIVFHNYDVRYAEWLDRLAFEGPLPPTNNSTCGDYYYKIVGGGRLFEKFLEAANDEIKSVKARCLLRSFLNEGRNGSA